MRAKSSTHVQAGSSAEPRGPTTRTNPTQGCALAAWSVGVTKMNPLYVFQWGVSPGRQHVLERPQMAKVWKPQACQGDLLYLSPTALGSHPPGGDRQTICVE